MGTRGWALELDFVDGPQLAIELELMAFQSDAISVLANHNKDRDHQWGHRRLGRVLRLVHVDRNDGSSLAQKNQENIASAAPETAGLPELLDKLVVE